MSEPLHGTKEMLFDAALRMFATISVDQVSMRDIAGACGIRASSIYNHFEGKQHILDTIYAYFEEVFPQIHRRVDDAQDIAKNGTKEQFVKILVPDFEFLPPPQRDRIILCCKIIYMRMHHDEDARALFLNHLTNTAPIREFLDYAIQIGRLRPFDLDTYCNIITGYHNYIGIKQFIRPDYGLELTDQEQQFAEVLVHLLPFQY